MSGILSAIAASYAITSVFPSTVKVLVVGGGGGGGNSNGGGGGAGGLLYDSAYAITNDTAYTVTVGAGGAGVIYNTSNATNGGDSVFGTLTAVGGGRGGVAGQSGFTANPNGANGGSGGGALWDGVGGTGTVGQGNNGGGGGSPSNYPGGGGGGAGGAGVSGDSGGAGGVGVENSISGTPTYYAGGGGGGSYGTGGNGGNGGGGNGGSGNPSSGTNGTDGLGGGGGGTGGFANGGNGGSGVVIISYVGSPIATGGTITSSGGNTIHTFTSSGNFIVGTPPVTYATWNPADKDTYITLSGGDLVATDTISGPWSAVRSTIGKSSGKWYWELTITDFQVQQNVGIAGGTYPLNSQLGIGDSYAYSSVSYKYHEPDYPAYGASWTEGDIIGIALDMTGGTLEFFKNGASQGVAYTGLSGTYYAAFSGTRINDIVTANFGASAFTYSPPAGYNAGLYE